MRAWVLHGINNYRLCDVPIPIAKDGEILVKVKAAGICSSDIARVYSTGAYHYPIIPGHEFSGETADGRRVGVFPLIPCFECESCNKAHYETCSNYSYIGSRQDGAFAEYVTVPEWNLIELPDDMPYEAAALLEPAAVALHAVQQLDLTCVNAAAIVGDGAIGRLIAKWLAIYGVNNIAIVGKLDKISVDVDACFEAAGNVNALRRCIELAKPDGQLVLVGNPDVDFSIDQKLYWQILRKQLTIRGSWNSQYPANWKETLTNADKLMLDELITHRYAFAELDNAFEMMRTKSGKHIKVITAI